MQISRKQWGRYLARLAYLNGAASGKIANYLQKYGLPATEDEIARLIAAAFAISDSFGTAAAEIAAEMFDYIAERAGVAAPPAELAPTPTYGEVAKAIRGTLKTGNSEIVADSIGRLVKRTGVDTTLHNAIRSGAQFAWIPQGDTCAFCLALASRGWQTASKAALKNGHAEHIHANCDCTYAVRFDETTNVAGYDPDAYLRMYREAEGDTPKDKINAMRREIYDEHAEEINAQKRSAYEKRKERESDKAEELDV